MDRRCFKLSAAGGLLLAGLSAAWGHGGEPQVLTITHPAQFPGEAWAITNNQGIFAVGPEGSRWLCEDAVAPSAGVRAAIPVGAEGTRWLVATDLGLYVTEDGGCSFSPAEGALADHAPLGIWPAPSADPAQLGRDALIATATFDAYNDVYWTEDGGIRWQAAGLDVAGRIYSLVRGDTPETAELVYVTHAEGAARSDDGGRTFSPIALGPEDLSPLPIELSVIAIDRGDPDTVYAVLQRFPTSILLMSADRGASWAAIADLDEYPRGMITTASGQALLAIPFAGELRRDQAEGPWRLDPPQIPLLGCLTEGPEGDLWACSNVFFGGPWVMAQSEDLGRQWQPVLSQFNSVTPTWGCPEDSRSALACAEFCPGQGAGASGCAITPDAGTPDAGAPSEDGGTVDGEDEGRSRGGGCDLAGGAGGPWWWILIGLGWWRASRRITPE